MPLNGMTISIGATSAAATGGTATPFNQDGVVVSNGIHVANLTEPDFRVRSHVTFKTRVPTLQADGSYSKARRDIILTQPKILADGSVSFQVARIGLEFHPEASEAEVLDLSLCAAQLLFDADTASFIKHGSLA